MSAQEDRTTRRTTVVPDTGSGTRLPATGLLTTRLLAFLQGPAGSAPQAGPGHPAPDLPAADPALVERLRAAHAGPRLSAVTTAQGRRGADAQALLAELAGPRHTGVPGPRDGRATSR